jgi:hypothetical protein
MRAKKPQVLRIASVLTEVASHTAMGVALRPRVRAHHTHRGPILRRHRQGNSRRSGSNGQSSCANGRLLSCQGPADARGPFRPGGRLFQTRAGSPSHFCEGRPSSAGGLRRQARQAASGLSARRLIRRADQRYGGNHGYHSRMFSQQDQRSKRGAGRYIRQRNAPGGRERMLNVEERLKADYRAANPKPIKGAQSRRG